MTNSTAPKENLSPEEMAQQLELIVQKKVNYPWWKTFVLAILGGIFISFGAMFASTVSAGAANIIPYGLIKLLSGVSFSLGLILVIIGGAELFTGSTIVSVGVVNKSVSLVKLIKNWMIVYFGNFVGSVLIASLMVLGKQYMCGNASVGLVMITTALLKLQHSFIEAMALGILCNMLVCLAIWLSYSTKSIAGKIVAMIFPITAFVTAGFEHSVANMYFVPVAILIQKFDPVYMGMNISELTLTNFLVKNLLPVTIGNIIGGVSIWLTLNFLYKKHA